MKGKKILVNIAATIVIGIVTSCAMTGIVFAEEEDVDTTPPSIEGVVYSTTEPTNGDVIVIISANEKLKPQEGWSLATNELSIVKAYPFNATETVTVQDLAGNTASVEISITNIDKMPPEIKSLTYSTQDPTNKNVTVTIITDEPIEPEQGWKLESDRKTMSRTYSENVSEFVMVKDLVGNVTSAEVIINNIDKAKPDLTVTYTTTEETEENVIAFITSNEEIQTLDGWTLSEDQKMISKSYTKNTTETIEVSDLAGNTSLVEVTINNIKSKEESTLLGDINGDGKLTSTDLILLKRILVGLVQKTEQNTKVADLNGDGKITVTDLLVLKRKLVGLS